MERRNKFIVDKKFQLRVFYKIFILITLTIAICGGVLAFYTINGHRVDGFINNVRYFMDNAGTNPEIAGQLKIILVSMLVSLAVTLVISSVITLIYSHRIAGPVYRMKKVIDEISKGNFDIDVRVRKEDEFKDLAEKIKEMTVQLKKRYGRRRKFINEDLN